MNKIALALSRIFEKHRIVFFHDAKKVGLGSHLDL